MFDSIIKMFFYKEQTKKKVKTIIHSNRENQVLKNAQENYFNNLKNPESQETCLSEYFKNNKGLNYIERNTKLHVATIVG